MRFFVTGTDTGVGKTFVTGALARHATARGHRVLAFKPIETGVIGDLGDDQTALVAAAGGWQTGPARGVYRFVQPAAPLVAAATEARAIDLELIRSTLAEAEVGADLVLVEGAGGLRVPITANLDMAGLAAALRMPLIVVARAGLGTINHTLLTVEAAERDGLRVTAVVLSRRPEDDAGFAISNADQIRARWPTGPTLVFDGSPAPLAELLGLGAR